ncbi:IRR1 [[Candida] subhashii]|uniref:IRR1 n=1 Tax=[Candida] subhashii TaxID=561895 RepID=A0A8J5QFT9_9ASCO|nr:IRR1 [[Candida] subhashii]KAG7662157.1 IRR1 [[Candida] subhashii]
MVRRSTRRKANPTIYKDASDSEDSESDYEAVENVSTKKRSKSSSKGVNSTTKRQRKDKTKSLEELEEELEENYLYQALAHTEVDVSEIALDWIESYQEDQTNGEYAAITMLINLILRSCGSVYLFQPHDLSELESSAETVGEITIAFGKQSLHKFPYKALPVFKKNVVQFFEKIIEISHERGLLYKYEEDDEESNEEVSLASPLMTYIITWITSLTTSQIRPLRIISTELILIIQKELCNIIKNVTSNLDKSQKQLSKIKKTNKARYKTVSSTIQSYQKQQATLTEYFDDIGQIVINHRYRDIDPQIRLSCLKYLSDTIISYPDYFCKDTYIRYFGWLLSDPASTVRAENTKVLLRLYKSLTESTSTPVLRQFTERFKKNFIRMCRIDTDPQVRIHSLGICCELFRLGFLEDSDTESIIKDFPLDNLAKSNLTKLHHEFARFVHVINENQVEYINGKYKLFLENYKLSQFNDDLGTCLKIKNLVDVLSKSENNIEDTYRSLCEIAGYESNWEFLMKYFLADMSSLQFTENLEGEENPDVVDNEETQAFKDLIELNESHRVVLLKFIQGSLSHLCKTAKSAKDQEEVSNQLIKMIDYLPRLQTHSIKSSKLFPIFLSIWTNFIGESKDAINLFHLFTKLNREEEYDEVTIKILDYYKESSQDEKGFDDFFKNLFASQGLTSPVKSQLQNLLQELVVEVTNSLNEHSDELEDFVEAEEFELENGTRYDSRDVKNQNDLLVKLKTISPVLVKIGQLGCHVNIAQLSNISDLIDALVSKTFGVVQLPIIMASLRYNFLQQLPSFRESIETILDLLLTVLSWKCERLILLPSEHQQYVNITTEFEDMVDVVKQVARLIGHCDKNEKLVDLKTLLCEKYIDFLVSFKIFYVRFDNKNEFNQFETFFSLHPQLWTISAELQSQLLELFLIKEVRLANELKVDLERGDQEGVNFDDYLEADETNQYEKSMFDDENDDEEEEEHPCSDEAETEEVNSKKGDRIWNYEKSISLYTLKLISLINLSMVSDDIHKRLKLNADKLGSVYSRIINQLDEHQAKLLDKRIEIEKQRNFPADATQTEEVPEENGEVDETSQNELDEISLPNVSLDPVAV